MRVDADMDDMLSDPRAEPSRWRRGYRVATIGGSGTCTGSGCVRPDGVDRPNGLSWPGFGHIRSPATDPAGVRRTIGWTRDGRPDEEWLTTERPGALPSARPPLLSRRLPASVSAVALIALCGLGAWSVGPLLTTWGLSSVDLSDNVFAVARAYQARPAGWPAASGEEAASPLGVPAALTTTSSSYDFEQREADGSPVAYDPCRPVHYVIRTAGAPAGGEALVRAAVASIAQATGLRFVEDGASDEARSNDRAAYQPQRYGNRWAPVLIAWADPAEDPRLDADVAGLAGSVAYGLDGGPMVYVTGQVELDGPQVEMLEQSPDGQQIAMDVVEHELGHLVGLAHVDDPTQLMYPELVGAPSGLGVGDRTGLAARGRGACVADI